MPERHSVDFTYFGFNLVSDHESGTITLQFNGDSEWLLPEPGAVSRAARPILKAIRRRYGAGALCRLRRRWAGEGNPFVLPPCVSPHPESPEVACFAMRLGPGERLDPALAGLLEFLGRQPGYQRTFGPPLDRDVPVRRDPKEPTVDAASLAGDALRRLMERPHSDF
jgi:hypothetical protein